MLCERIALIQNGEILSINTPEKIIAQFPHKLFAVRADKMGLLLKDIRKCEMVESCNSFGEFHHITFRNGENGQNPMRLYNWLEERNHTNINIESIRPTIEDCFINLMK